VGGGGGVASLALGMDTPCYGLGLDPTYKNTLRNDDATLDVQTSVYSAHISFCTHTVIWPHSVHHSLL